MSVKNRVLVVAPHADDESLGCAGTILKHIEDGDKVYWLLVTEMRKEFGFNSDQIARRKEEIRKVTDFYGFEKVIELGFPAAQLDVIAKGKIVAAISDSIKAIRPDIVYAPYRNDAHSDHEVVFDTVISATKTFRYPFVKQVLVYETLSETDFGLKPEDGGFKPNVYVDISTYINQKLDVLAIFESEMGNFPFPRSPKAILALATLRGAQCGCESAESFMLIKEIR